MREVKPHRLLAEDIYPRIEKIHRRIVVQIGRKRDRNEIKLFLLYHFLIIGIKVQSAEVDLALNLFKVEVDVDLLEFLRIYVAHRDELYDVTLFGESVVI